MYSLSKGNRHKTDLIAEKTDQIANWIVITDISGTILYANSEVEKLSGYKIDEILGKKPSIFKSELVSDNVYKELWETILKGEPYINIIVNRHKNGNLYYLANTISPIKNEEGEIEHFISIAKPIVNDGKLGRKIHTTIHHDRLTGLLNRDSFIYEISMAKNYHKRFAVMAIKINKLNLINSKYGFLFGDKVIKEVGHRIQENIGKKTVLSRVEGQVFGLIVPSYKDRKDLITMIKKIRKSVAKPLKIKDKKIHVSISFGVATCTEDEYETVKEMDQDILLTRAQLALSHVKNNNTLASYEFYTPEMNKKVSNIISIENKIHGAFDNQEFKPYFQPVIDLKTCQVYGYEALIRWERENGELVGPNKFIGFLEETGLIIDVGINLIEQTCIQIRKWIDEYGYSLPIAINLSTKQFEDKYFCDKIKTVLTKYKIPSNLLIFEITESMLIKDINRTLKILDKLQCNGFSVSLDDFGTGYSSLSYIQKLKINTIKVDMSFIRNITHNEADQAIVKAIIGMAKALNLKTIAEGVETKEQLDMVKKLGCNMGQGYYWDKPLPANEIRFK